MFTKILALLSSDVVFLGVLLVIFFAFTMYFGRGRIISLILSFYPATLLYKSFPFMDKLAMDGDMAVTYGKIGIFLIFLIPINIVIGKYVFSESFYTGGEHIFRNIGLSLTLVILIILFSYNTVNFDALHNFSPAIDAIFSGADRTFWWNIAPIILLGVL